MPYIHERPDWPTFAWEAQTLEKPLAEVRHRQGRLLGRMEALGFELQAEATLRTLTADVVKSSAIEGEDLNADEVRSSIARRLGMDVGGYIPVGRDVDGIVEMMLDATQNYEGRLTAERLFGWHAALFPTGRSGLHRIAVGAWRPIEAGPMQVVSGPFGRERVHFEAPSADRLDGEMTRFVEWFNAGGDLDPVLKAGLAHLWFVTIHPFEDGNGRIARAIADMALARADRTRNRFYSMSSQIEAERREYYEQLEAQQRGTLDVTTWLSWFLACLDRALTRADGTLTAVTIKARTWEAINRKPINDRQRTIINRLLDGFQGNLTTSKYAKITKSSSDTALRDIRELVERGILVQNPGGGRSTSYRLASPEEMPDQAAGRS
ncbi:MAG: Fic family protein [Hyphomicrobium sp.]|jgi:Fic family protein|uniref:Fic family protein n=1 Tax=Hyphomicrobium sp. TaxID=82 RepID=UPI0025BFD065|nr:Fic family protein [Hyphomicrobium sp.]MBX9865143.1 Fic family protein [Hyphomicrobium sp.]